MARKHIPGSIQTGYSANQKSCGINPRATVPANSRNRLAAVRGLPGPGGSACEVSAILERLQGDLARFFKLAGERLDPVAARYTT
jgi:hypothetical protein